MIARIVALAIAASLGVVGQETPTADAAPYTVKQCSNATNYTDFGFQSYINANIRNGGTTCQGYALYTIANPNVTYSNGTWGGFTAYAPGGVNITGFSANLWELWNNFGGGNGTPMRAVGEAGSARFADDLATIFSWSTASLVSWGGAGGPATGVFIGFKCLNGSGCNHQGVDKRVRFRDVTFTMDDPTAPSITGVGGSLTTAGWKHGNETLSLSASDSGGGIAAIAPTVDQGSNPPVVAGDCPRAAGYYVRMAACALSRSGSVSVNTAAIANGTRTFTIRATDAAGTPSAARTISVKIDNEPPPAPSNPTVAGGSQWRRANDFSIAWTNPSESDRAPIVRSHWEACPLGGGVCVQGSDGGTDRVTGISLPRPGEYNAAVWVEDTATNGSPGDSRRKESVAVRLRYDPDPP